MSLSFKAHRSFRFQLACALCTLPATAWAQAGQAELVAPVPNAEPPAAPAAPAEPARAAAPVTDVPAASEPPPASQAPPQSDEPDAEPGTHNKKKKKHDGDERGRDARDDRGDRDAEHSTFAFGGTGGTLLFKGRVFALAELSHRNETVVGTTGTLEDRETNALDLSLASARFGLEYHSPLRWLSAELELEITDKPQVKDAFVLAGKRFFAKAGQFKLPTAALELESPWTLPTLRRGFVHDLLSDWLDVGSRRPGVAFGYRGKGDLKPRVTLGAFQGTTLKEVAPGDRNVDLIEEAALDAQSLAARVELTLLGVDFGAWYEHRVGSTVVGDFEHYETGGLDAMLDHRFESGGVRLWLDGIVGESFYVTDDKPGDDKEPLFATARALAGYRFGGVQLGDPYLEPFAFFGLLDPDLEVVSDYALEGAIGVNAGFWDRARVGVQGELTRGERNFPTGFLDNQDPDRMSLLLQAGARF
jgi:hypothetical protein